MTRPNALFEQVLTPLTDRQREHVEAAYALLEHSSEPVHRRYLPAFEDATAWASLRTALSRLTALGLLKLVRGGQTEGGYVPGPQLLRLAPAARERLQDQLILAAAPDHPLASAIRDRRRGIQKG